MSWATTVSYCGECGESSPAPLCWANSCNSPTVTSPPSKIAIFLESGSTLATGSAGLQPATTTRNTPASKEANHALFTESLLKTTENLAVRCQKRRDYSTGD